MKHVALAAGLVFFLMGCSDSKTGEDQASIKFSLTDMPGEYQRVDIDIVGVSLILNDSLVELTTNQGVYNLLEFVNGKDTLLVDEEIPGGYLSQIRLVLGKNNTVMIDSIVHELTTPSAQQSGLKLNVQNEIVPGESYSYTIDFMVEKSIVETGSGKYILKPVIRVYTDLLTGSIEGVVSPAEAKPNIMAIGNGDTTSTFADTSSGQFMIRGLYEGVYSLEIKPVGEYKDASLTGINVLAGQTTVLEDTIIIQ